MYTVHMKMQLKPYADYTVKCSANWQTAGHDSVRATSIPERSFAASLYSLAALPSTGRYIMRKVHLLMATLAAQLTKMCMP